MDIRTEQRDEMFLFFWGILVCMKWQCPVVVGLGEVLKEWSYVFSGHVLLITRWVL